MENDVLYNRIMNVVHEEYGEGSTAVANPEGEATDALEKIQIGDDVYSISGGGGGENVFIAHPTESGTSTDFGFSFNDAQTAFLSGKNIVLDYDVPDATFYAYFQIISINIAVEDNTTYYSIYFNSMGTGGYFTNASIETTNPDENLVYSGE